MPRIVLGAILVLVIFIAWLNFNPEVGGSFPSPLYCLYIRLAISYFLKIIGHPPPPPVVNFHFWF
jgi:hypothetical protein